MQYNTIKWSQVIPRLFWKPSAMFTENTPVVPILGHNNPVHSLKHSISSGKILKLFSHFRPGISSGLFPPDSKIITEYAHLTSRAL
jgi:hypothetical protein